MITVQHDLARLNKNLSDYLLFSKLTMAEVLDKKGNDLRIQLFRGFWAQKFGGKSKSGIAWRELAARAQRGIGTLVRQMFIDADYNPPDVDKNGRPLTLWQKLVWQETERRQQGIGLLGVSFLSKRWRTRKSRSNPNLGPIVAVTERYLDRNVSRKLGTLLEIQKDDNSFTIRGMTPGLQEVSEKYGIKQKAIQSLNTDMEIYLARKFGEASRRAFAA